MIGNRVRVCTTQTRVLSTTVVRYCSSGSDNTTFSAAASSTEHLLPPAQKKLNKAMLMYLDRARKRQSFMQSEQAEFEMGKRHLANMMGLDPYTITQQQVNEAVEYLFPSGLYSKAARPTIKPPEEIWSKQKAAEFDESGRPLHPLFYTLRPNFYQLLHNIFAKYEKLERFAARQGDREPPEKLILGASTWLDQDALSLKLVETLSDQQYAQFTTMGDHFCEHPYSYLEREFINEYRHNQSDDKSNSLHQYTSDILTDQSGRQYVEAEGKRKSVMVKVRVTALGSGNITINGRPLGCVTTDAAREQIVSPLLLLDRPFEFDVDAVQTAGEQQDCTHMDNAIAGAVRLGLARALCPFLDDTQTQMLRLAGLLNWDVRRRERKKPGKHGARRSATWLVIWIIMIAIRRPR